MIFEDEAHVDEWTKIGTPLHTFDIARGDDVTFRVASTEAGHYNASVTPHFVYTMKVQKKSLIYLE